jgi:drug/metabolite transporter (DMT)-like permease
MEEICVSAKKGALAADALLLLAAIIWGFAFSAQRSGMEHIGPLAYNGIRYALGSLVLLPLIAVRRRRAARAAPDSDHSDPELPRLRGAGKAAGIALAGTIIFAGSILQQLGIVTTTAGNAGFITSLYVVLVPLIGFFFGKPSNLRIWAGALIAVAGLYILSVSGDLTMSKGDLLVLVGSLFWAFHILVVAKLVARLDAIELAAGQFAVCAAFSLAGAFIFEPAPFAGAIPAAIPILYGGLLSCGVAFTLQVVGQKTAHPAHASIILSMEALFAGIGGVILLDEPLTLRLVIGGLCMLAGAMISQLEPPPKRAQSG